jgi:hypothetical protein
MGAHWQTSGFGNVSAITKGSIFTEGTRACAAHQIAAVTS